MSIFRPCTKALAAFVRAPLQQAGRRYAVAFAVALSAIGLGVPAQAAAQGVQMSSQAAAQIASLLAEKASRNAAQRKIDSQLLYASRMARGLDAAPGVPALEVNVPVDGEGLVEVDIRAKVGGKVEALVRAAGGRVVRTFEFSDSIEARVPFTALETIASSDLVRFIAPKAKAVLQRAGRPVGAGSEAEPATRNARLARWRDTVQRAVDAANERKSGGGAGINAGTVTSQGDATHRADAVRATLGFTGAGMCIGVLSDSFDAAGDAAKDVASGNLPGAGAPFAFSQPVGLAGSGDDNGVDEGRAMLQIVHDLAPGARLYFATGTRNDSDFANNIRALRGIAAAPGAFGNVFPKCDVIVDDLLYLHETGLHDGQLAPSNRNIAIITQAVNDVVNDGGLYFSSAGNYGNVTQGSAGAWEGDYIGAAAPAPLAAYADALAWSGADVGNTLLADGTSISLHWSDPIGASGNDYDLFRLDAAMTTVKASSTNIQDGTQDPLELVSTGRDTRLVVARKAGAAARFVSLKTTGGVLQYATTGQTRGHGASPLAMGVAATPAAAAYRPPTPNGPYPNPFVGSNQIELFSADGPRRSFFNADGSAITPGNFLAGTGGGIVRLKPDMTAADGVATTLPPSGLNPFYGTSAAAPHAAAIAALIKQGLPNAAPAAITDVMKATALDIMAPGPDRDSGFGIVQAYQAVQAAGGTLGAMVRPTATKVAASGGNKNLEPNECSTLDVPMINEGTADATAVSATIASSTPGIALTRRTAPYADLPANGGAASGSAPFEVSVARAVACGSSATFTQTVSFAGGVAPRAYTFTLPIGTTQQYTFATQPSVGLPPGATGPITDSDMYSHIFDVTVPAGFNFYVYGKAVAGGSVIRASTYGNVQIQPSGGTDESMNGTLPSSAFDANPVVLPYWDNINLVVVGGGIYTNLVGVAPNRQFVIEWRGKRQQDYDVTTVTLHFGVLFHENSGTIEFRYPKTDTETEPRGANATVGVQNTAVPGQYTQFSFKQPVIASGTVIRGTVGAACGTSLAGQCSTPLFADVPSGYWAAREINTVYNTFPRVSNGCLASPLRFCPADPVTREQMAAFIIRAKEGEPSPTLCAGGSPFLDVPQGSPSCPYIKRMQQLGISNGCGNGNYCPASPATREQAVILLVRALEGDPAPALCSGGSPFSDVLPSSPWCPHVVRAVQLGITNGCTPTAFCPLDQASRDETAVFLVRGFKL